MVILFFIRARNFFIFIEFCCAKRGLALEAPAEMGKKEGFQGGPAIRVKFVGQFRGHQEGFLARVFKVKIVLSGQGGDERVTH